jgi:hypothetical protein
MSKMNLKEIPSAIAALVLTTIVSWGFVDATRITNMISDNGPTFLSAISTLVR